MAAPGGPWMRYHGAMESEPHRVHVRRCRRLRTLLARHGLRTLLVTSRPNRWYLTGLDTTVGGVWIGPDSVSVQVDGRYAVAATEWQARFGPQARVLVCTGHWLDGPVAEAGGPVGVEVDHVSAAEWLALQTHPSGPVPCRGMVEALRAVKDGDELQALGLAAAITRAALGRAVRGLRPGITEVDVARALALSLRGRGEDTLPFTPLVAGGSRTQSPHPAASLRALQTGEPILLDAGARAGGYAADLAVTTWLGPPPPRLRAARRAVRIAMAEALALVRPGVPAARLDAACRDALRRQGFGGDYPHDTGHGVGLEIHEAPRISPDSNEVLEAGMVITLEPAWYDPCLGGVRLEDMVIVTDEGPRLFRDVVGAGEGFPLLEPS